MATPSMQDVLAQLASQQAQIADLQAARRRARRRFPRRLLPLALVALFVALMPLSAFAAISFNDLNAGSVHNPNIQAIADAGITTGCVPNVSYCPNDNVTREEMASFLARTAGLGANKPVANAARLALANPAAGGQTFAANELIRVARVGGSGADLALTSAFAEVATITITAPGHGLVVVTGAATVLIGGPTPSVGTAEIRLHDTTVAGGGTSPVQIVSGRDGAYASGTPTWLFNAGTGGPRTYVLEARVSNGIVSAVRTSSSMTAIFAPFGSDGATQEH